MSAASKIPRKNLLRTPSGIGGSNALLAALQSAHRRIDDAFSEIESVAAAKHADPQRFNAARLRIAQLNLARRRLVNEVCSHLISFLSAEEREAVRELRRRDGDCFQDVSDLVRRWTPDAIISDWGGYCVASRATRAGILAIVAAEKELLYPLLGRNS
jgi:hypothetical protein